MSGISLDFVTPRWESPDWKGEFYPEDLPEDWRLAYFSNEFPSVLMPASRWVLAGADEWADWISDVPESFRIYLEFSPRSPPDGLSRSIREILGQHLAGVLCSSPIDGVNSPPVLDVPVFCRFPDSDSRSGCLPAVFPVGDSLDDLRAARAWLADLARRFGEGQVLVVLDDRSADAESLRRWWQLAWLMGLA